MRIIFSFLLLTSLTCPLFTIKNNPTDTAYEFIKDKISAGEWGNIANHVLNIATSTNNVEHEKKNIFYQIKDQISSGYGNGISSIGAVFIVWNNYRYDQVDVVPILPVFIIILTLVQLFYHSYFYKNRNSIISIMNMILVLYVFGNCIGHEYYSGYFVGTLIFLAIQITYMIYFYWFPYISVKDECGEIQKS